jgi:dienelactone hydrolase
MHQRPMSHRAARFVVAAVLFASLSSGVAACTPTGWPHEHAPHGHAARGHTTWTETFVDTSRPTVPVAGPAAPSRTLETAIYRPDGWGRFPLIVFAHGIVGHPEKFTKLFSAWADAGFVVAAPAFPLTNSHAANPLGNAGDAVNQPADMSFVLDQVLAMNRRPGSRLFHAIDEREIGAGGLSLGGFTTYLLVYGECCRDNRIRAAEVLDGIEPGAVVDGHVPLYIGHADTDPLLPYAGARTTYDRAPSPVWLVTLHGASHASEWEDTVTPYDRIAEETTTDFWKATLDHRRHAFERLERDATVAGLSSIENK